MAPTRRRRILTAMVNILQKLFCAALAGALFILYKPARGLYHKKSFQPAEGTGISHHAAQSAGKALGALLELLHHLLHHLKLLEQLVHVGHGGTAAGRDTALALGIDDGGLLALFFGHGIDHGLNAVERLFIDLTGIDAAAAGQHAQHRACTAHLADLCELVQHVVHVELVLHHPLGGLFGSLFVCRLLCALDQAQHIAHAQNTACHAVRVEHIQIVQLFAGALELDGLAHLLHCA